MLKSGLDTTFGFSKKRGGDFKWKILTPALATLFTAFTNKVGIACILAIQKVVDTSLSVCQICTAALLNMYCFACYYGPFALPHEMRKQKSG